MKSYNRIVLLIALIVATGSVLKAQWVQTNGPDGAYVNTFFRDGSSILVGTELGGIFRSTDDGRSWSMASPTLMNRRIRAIVRSGSDLFAGSLDRGVYRSSDNGATWSAVNSGLPTRKILAMGINGTTIFAGSNSGSKVFRSTDRGNSWTDASVGLTGQYFGATYFLTVGTNIYVGTYGDGVFRSSNNGDSWQAVNTGLPVQTCCNNVSGFVTIGNSLFVAIGQDVFRSTDSGASWKKPDSPAAGTSDGIESLAEYGGQIYAGSFKGGIYRSIDSGLTWTLLARGDSNVSVWALLAGESSIVAGTRFGAFVSTDNGSTWQSGDTGLRSQLMKALAVLGPKLFAGSFGGGVNVSTNKGEDWIAANDGLTNTYVMSFATGVGMLFAGTNGGGVFRTTDDGATWTTSNTKPDYLAIQALAINNKTVFAGALNVGVLRSMDSGASWEPVNTGLNTLHVSSLAGNGAYVFAGMDDGVYRSADNGESWSAVLDRGRISALAVTGTTVFAGSQGGGISRSINNGDSWTRVNNGLGNGTVGALIVNGAEIYAGTDNGVYRSTDNGDSWSAVGSELAYASVAALVIQDNTLFAATNANSVWRYQLASAASVNSPRSARAASDLLAYPNPTSASSTLRYVLPGSARVSISLYDATGRIVANPVNDLMTEAGSHDLVIDTRSLAAGVYSCSVTTGGSSVSTTLVVVH